MKMQYFHKKGGRTPVTPYAGSATDSRDQLGDRLYSSESDVYRGQILTYKNDPRTEKIKIFIMAADP